MPVARAPARLSWAVLFGGALLVAIPTGLLVLVLQPDVRAPLARVAATLAGDWWGDPEREHRFPFALEAMPPAGHPVWPADPAAGTRPVAWVVGADEGGIVLRFAPGVDASGPWTLHAIPTPLDFGELLQVAVPPESARELESRILGRAGRLLQESLLPEIEARLPDFLARIDPRTDPAAREVFDAVGAAIVERMRPLARQLGESVVRDLEARFDLWDRMGLLWRVLRGDGKGLSRRLMPVAEESVNRWWAEHRDEVLTAVGEGVAAETPRWRAWVEDAVVPAARDEVAAPVFAAQRERLEQDLEAALGEVLDTVVNAPEGGFRVRFAAVIRNRLLGKREPLLLLERRP